MVVVLLNDAAAPNGVLYSRCNLCRRDSLKDHYWEKGGMLKEIGLARQELEAIFAVAPTWNCG